MTNFIELGVERPLRNVWLDEQEIFENASWTAAACAVGKGGLPDRRFLNDPSKSEPSTDDRRFTTVYRGAVPNLQGGGIRNLTKSGTQYARTSPV